MRCGNSLIQPGQNGGKHFSPPQNQLPLYTRVHLIHGRFIPPLFSLNFVSFWKEQTDATAAGFDSDGQP